MTITTMHTIAPYIGDGEEDTFVGTFEMLDTDDLVVLVDGEPVAVAAITGNTRVANQWSVRLAAAPADLSSVHLKRSTTPQQETNYTAYGRYRATQHELDFDKLMALVQELLYGLSKALHITDDQLSDGVSTALPEPDANHVIGWNGSANALANFDIADFATVAAYGERVVEGFDGEEDQTEFVLAGIPASPADVHMVIGGYELEPGEDFTLSGQTITLAIGLPADMRCFVRYGRAVVSGATGLTGSKVHDFDGTDGATTTLTVTGAATGDDVLVTWADATADVAVRGYVSAADTVTLVKTGAGNPGSLTYLVRVFSRALEA